jgi:hypothetical protein
MTTREREIDDHTVKYNFGVIYLDDEPIHRIYPDFIDEFEGRALTDEFWNDLEEFILEKKYAGRRVDFGEVESRDDWTPWAE